MPEYINITTRNGSYSNGVFYKQGERAILPESYAEKHEKSWKLASEHDAEMNAAREADALNESPEDTIKRLKRELKEAEKAKKSILKSKERVVDSELNSDLMKPKKTEEVAGPVEVTPKVAPQSYQELLTEAKAKGYKGSGKKVEVESFLAEKESE